MDIKDIVEIISAVSIPIAIVAIVVNRVMTKKGLSVRSIQFLGLATVPPLVVVLALEGLLERSAVGALIGGLIGYLFSNFSEYDRRKGGETES